MINLKTYILFLLFCGTVANAQSFKVDRVNGNVQALIWPSEKWADLKTGQVIDTKTVLATGANSSVQLSNNNFTFTLKEYSALNTSQLKKVSLDELLLALAMNDVSLAARKQGSAASQNSGSFTSPGKGVMIKSENFGIKKLNGAVQLSESGFNESAVMAAKETFRKYPETNSIPSYRIYFAKVLMKLGLNEEANKDFNFIKNLNLTDSERKEVEKAIEITKKQYH